MNDQLLMQYKMILVGLAEYYGKDITPNQIKMYSEDLLDLTPEELTVAVKCYRTNPENKFFPLPAQLIEEIKPHMDERDDARDVSNLVIAAVSRYGYTNPKEAEKSLGSLAWEVIRRMGGWQSLCENLTTANIGMFRAQIRDYAETVSKKSKRGDLDLRPALTNQNESIKELIGNTILELE